MTAFTKPYNIHHEILIKIDTNRVGLPNVRFKLRHSITNRYKHLNQLSGQTVWTDNIIDSETVFEMRSSSVEDHNTSVTERPPSLHSVIWTVVNKKFASDHPICMKSIIFGASLLFCIYKGSALCRDICPII